MKNAIVLLSFIFLSACSYFQRNKGLEIEEPKQQSSVEVSNNAQPFKAVSLGQSMEDVIVGWSSLLQTVESYAGREGELTGQSFDLRVLMEGRWNLRITPFQAFKISKGFELNSYQVTIVNPNLLFDRSGGISKMGYVEAELSRYGGQKGSLEISAEVDCQYRVKFTQGNGQPVNFQTLESAYDYDFLLTPSDSLKVVALSPEMAFVVKNAEDERPSSIQLKLIKKDGKEAFLSNRIQLPQCLKTPKFDMDTSGNMPPGLCLRHYLTRGSTYDQSKSPKQEVSELFGNLCDRSIRCQMKARYGLVTSEKVASAVTQTYLFTVEPRSTKVVDASWEYRGFDPSQHRGKLYLGSYYAAEAIPSGFDPNQLGPVRCDWAR